MRYFVRIEKALDDFLVFPLGTYWRDGEKRDFTQADATEMVRNFDDDVLERRIPVNLEHDRLRGRVGYIARLWAAKDGVRGQIEPAGGQEDTLTRFDHVSPEVRWEWSHPYSNATHRNVLMGLALTNYPYLLGRMALHADDGLWTPDGWTPIAKASLAEIAPPLLRKAEQEELLSLHRRMHQLWGGLFEDDTNESAGGLTREDVDNAHAMIVEEMARRKLAHDSPIEKAAVNLSNLPDEIMVTPGAVCLVGSSAEEPPPPDSDVDVLFRLEADKDDPRYFRLRRENVDLPVRKALGIPKGQFHPLDNPQGPHAQAVPLYDLVLRRKGATPAQLVEKADDEPARAEAATRFWAEHWFEMLPRSGKGKFTYQHHWRGLDEEQVGQSEAELLKGEGSVHGDLRLEGQDGLWGWTVFLGTTADNRKGGGDRLASLPPDDTLQTTPKQAQPKSWLRVGVGGADVSEPGEAGATSEKSAKFFAYDNGTYRIGMCREHAFELFLGGSKLKGRYMVQFAPVGGRRVWLVSRPPSQTPYVEEHDKDATIKELRGKGQKWLVWGDGKGKPEFINVGEYEMPKEPIEKAATIKAKAQRALRDMTPAARAINDLLTDRELPAAVRKEADDVRIQIEELRAVLKRTWADLRTEADGEKPPEESSDRAPFVHEVPFALTDAKQRIAYGVVLPPDQFDTQGHRMGAAEIEAACHKFMERSQALDEHHARLVQSDEAKVVECWIQREPVEWRFGERVTDVVPDSWCIGVKFYSDDLWGQVERGEITGFSPRGWGVLTAV